MDFKESLKDRVSIPDVLKKFYGKDPVKISGSKLTYVCPFHADSGPSLSVDLDKRFFRCFGAGCNLHGDIFTIATLYKHSTLNEFSDFDPYFSEAIDTICEAFHIEKPAHREDTSEEGRYYKIMKFTAELFHSLLDKFDKRGRKMWYDRGFTDKLIDEHMLGVCYAPNKDGAYLSLLKDKFGVFPYYNLGIVDKQGNCPFANRMTIPIKNSSGKFVSFTARTFVGDERKYKLMLSNKYYKKQDNLFLFNTCRGATEIILVEGHMDALSLHQAGYTNSVALAGCQFSTQHSLLLAGKSIVLALDNDDPGRKATAKILMDNPGDSFKVVKYEPEAKDFNDMLMAKEDIKIETVSDIEFLTMYWLSEYDDYKVVELFTNYAAKRIAACKNYEDYRKVAFNLIGFERALQMLNKYCGIEHVDILKIITTVYGL